MLLLLVLSIAIVVVTAGPLGFDANVAISTSTFQCLSASGYSYFIARVYRSLGAVDTVGMQNIKNAKAAGWTDVGGYIFPHCTASSCVNGGGQVQAVYDYMHSNGITINTLWLDIETYQWPSSTTANRAFITDMVNKAKQLNLDVGIYSSQPSWSPIVGNSFTDFSNLKLWWPRYDGHQDNRNFVAFGGWTAPTIHQYSGDANGPCSVQMDQNYRS